MIKALYPGTFDPVTNGHLDIIGKASELFEEVVITVAVNSKKSTLFSEQERIDLLTRALAERLSDRTNIVIAQIDGLLAEYARTVGANVIIRGLRTLGDFEYEMQMAVINRRIHHDLTTLFIPADERFVHLNSSIIREIARFGADTSGLVPDVVASALRAKFMNSTHA